MVGKPESKSEQAEVSVSFYDGGVYVRGFEKNNISVGS